MKTSRAIILSIVSLHLMAAPSAKAVLYLADDANFGPNAITVDTSTGLGWLNVSKAAGLSHQQVDSQTQAGGMFSGFRFATVEEVGQLYSSAGLTPAVYGDTAHYYPASSPAIQTFLALIGTTGIIYGLPGMGAFSGTSIDGGFGYLSPTVYGWSDTQKYWVNSGIGSTVFGASFSDPTMSSWLVKSVPEPAAGHFLVLAAAAWCGFTLLHRGRAVAPANAGWRSRLQSTVQFRRGYIGR